MSILLPEGSHWLVSNWISMGFFEDSRPLIGAASLLSDDIMFCLQADVDTLDLRAAHRDQLTQLALLVDAVIEKNTSEQAHSWSDPSQFEIYAMKLAELRSLLDRLLSQPPQGG